MRYFDFKEGMRVNLKVRGATISTPEFSCKFFKQIGDFILFSFLEMYHPPKFPRFADHRHR
jgi:hypothetical protein